MDLQNALKWLEISKIDGLDLHELKKKYRKLTLKYHPDRGGKTADFIKLQSAYNFLQECIKYPYAHKANQESAKSHKSNSQDYSQSAASNDIEFYKRQIEQLQKSNTIYQNLINSQIVAIKQFYNNLDQINTQSNTYNSNLGQLLDQELIKLNKKYKSDWWKGFVGFKTMDKSDLLYYQNQLIDEHNKLLSRSEKDNQQARYKAYQQIISEIVQGINLSS